VEREKIRVQYSGLIIFAAQIISIGTGLAFNLLLTRNLTKPEFGTWTNIFDLTSYFTIFAGLFPFWAVRFMARGKEGATKAVVASNLVMSAISMVLYLILVFPVTAALGVSSALIIVYALASVHIINIHLIGALESILRAKKPQVTGIGLLVSELSKIGLAYTIAVGFDQVILGAMIGFLIGEILQTVYYLKLLSVDLRHAIHWGYIKEWAKGSTANIFGMVGAQFANFIFILLFVYGVHGAARADYQAAATFAAVIGYASSLAFALYPKLLAQGCFEEVASSLRLMLMFALPMTALTIVMSPSLLTILDVSYSSASPVLIALAADALVIVLLTFYQFVLMGTEKFDEKATIHLGTLVKSKIFKVNSLSYIQAAITLPLVLYLLTSFVVESSQLAFYFAIIILFTHIILLTLVYVWTIRACRVTFPWVSVGKYLFASGIAGIAVFFLPHPTTVMLTLATLATGIGIYAAIILLIDKHARALVLEIIRQLPKISRGKPAKRK
jgi:O-antigen/teichoic acid export membrane protein